MSRFINPVPEYRPNSQLFFFKSGTNTQLVTYADEIQSIPNAHPVLTDALGNCPNIFYSGSAKLKVLDENDVQYIERDPVGGEKELGDFTLWDTTVSYNKNDIVEGSDGKFYISLSDANQANDPTTSPTKWNEIRFLGLWNTNITYATGDVVQTTTGNTWKALTATAGNDPEADDGTNWLPSIDGAKLPEVINLTWINKNADFTMVEMESYLVDASGGAVDITLPALVEDKVYTVHNESISTNTVLVKNPSYTIKGAGLVLSAGTDLELEPGDTAKMVAKSTTILEVV